MNRLEKLKLINEVIADKKIEFECPECGKTDEEE
jgi:predicted RNA-binding Zn-ribbon protein involved in translation (DUF1610 family)